MDFNLATDFVIFKPLLQKRPEIIPDTLKRDLTKYYLPFIEKLINLKKQKEDSKAILVGVSAIQGTGKTTQGEILDILLSHLGYSQVSLSIDDFYLTHQQLNDLRQKDPRFIRRGMTHDIPLAIKTLTELKQMQAGQTVQVPIYDKGKFDGDGDRAGFKAIEKPPDFIFFDGWMLGARSVEDESVFNSGLPALDTPEHIQFAKDINKKLNDYLPLWDLIDFLTVLYVVNFEDSLRWRDQAEDILRAKGEGMSHQEIKEFVYYFWRSVHPGIHIKNLAHDNVHTRQVVIINSDHTVKEVLSPDEVKQRYP